MSLDDQFSSDEDVFFGPVTRKEMRKRLFLTNYRQTIGHPHTNDQEDKDKSVKIIEIHSAPDILPKIEVKSPTITYSESSPDLSPQIMSDWDLKPDDTFLKLERMVSDLGVSPQIQVGNIDSTSDCKENLFSNQPVQPELTLKKEMIDSLSIKKSLEDPHNLISNDASDIKNTQEDCYKTPLKNNIIRNVASASDIKKEDCDKTPLENNLIRSVASASDIKKSQEDYKTPMKYNFIPLTEASPSTPADVFKTPLNNFKMTPIFKTPGNPASHKNKFTPSKKYENVASPVAAYIKKCPVVPLVKDVVCPRRMPMPGVSSIPKLIKSKQSSASKENMKPQNKDCMKLPSVAYRSAKETKLIKIPDDEKMPQNQWAKEVASCIPKAMIIKHGHREVSSTKKPLQHRQEESFGDLSLCQADLSVCTEKSAFNKPKKYK